MIRKFAPLTEAELETKLALAEATFQRHRRTTFAERAAKMIAAAEILENEQDRLAWLMTLEMGKPLEQARAEAAKCATACRYYAANAEKMLADEPIPDAEGHCFVRFEPIGAVLAVMPWNFPFWQVVRFAAPALMAGNVGLLKHAPNVPQCGFALEELFLRAGFAEGCFQNLADRKRDGAARDRGPARGGGDAHRQRRGGTRGRGRGGQANQAHRARIGRERSVRRHAQRAAG